MMRLNASNGCAPDSSRPLMKKAGVPGDAGVDACLRVGLDDRLKLAVVDALVELRGVEPERRRRLS